MNQFIGTKILLAAAMTLGAYNTHRGWTIPADEDPNQDGFLVEYENGYQSWSPKEAFDEAYRRTDNMNFGLALEALKMGYKVARAGWNGKAMFLFMRPADTLPVTMIPKVKSLPDRVKDHIVFITRGETHYASGDEITQEFGAYICMFAADRSIVNGWLASQTDMLSDDWVIVE